MTAMSERQRSASPTWEEVLASFEQAADEAEALITPEITPEITPSGAPGVAPGPNAPSPPVVAPAYDPWQLAMPPLPERLFARAKAVHARQTRLAGELETSMYVLRQHERIAGVGDEPPRAVYVDRTA